MRPDDDREGGRPGGGTLRGTESWRGTDYVVQPSSRSDRVFRCPGCDHEVDGATGHLVVWPDDLPDGVAGRRHWHTFCWRSRPGGR